MVAMARSIIHCRALLLAGLALLLSGCITLPLPTHATDDTENMQSRIGAADSKKLIRLDASSIEDVEDRFGTPIAVSPDRRSLLYFWRYCDGIRWAPLTITYFELARGTMWLQLNFDNEAVLRSTRSFKVEDPTKYYLMEPPSNRLPLELETAFPSLAPVPRSAISPNEPAPLILTQPAQ